MRINSSEDNFFSDFRLVRLLQGKYVCSEIHVNLLSETCTTPQGDCFIQPHKVIDLYNQYGGYLFNFSRV